MRKIDKRIARKIFNQGGLVFFVANNMRAECGTGITQKLYQGCDFDKLVNNYSYYNCNSECGNRVCFYVCE